MKNGVRTCGFSYSGNLIMFTTDKTMGMPCEIHIFDARDSSQLSKFLIHRNPFLCYARNTSLMQGILTA